MFRTQQRQRRSQYSPPSKSWLRSDDNAASQKNSCSRRAFLYTSRCRLRHGKYDEAEPGKSKRKVRLRFLLALVLVCVDSAMVVLNVVDAVHDHDRYLSPPPTKTIFSHRFPLPTISTAVRRLPIAAVPSQATPNYFNYYDEIVPNPFLEDSNSNNNILTVPSVKKPNKNRRQKVFSHARNASDNRFPIHILGLFELSAPDLAANARADLVAAQIAVEHVNERNYLPGYRLQLHVNDSKCRVGRGVNSFFHEIKEMQHPHQQFSLINQLHKSNPTTKFTNSSIDEMHRATTKTGEQLMFVLGPGPCDELAYVLAQITSFWNVIQVSFGATSPLLSACAHECYTFFRTVAPDNSHNSARRSFIKHHNWQRIAVLSESKKIYSLSADAIKRDLENLDQVELVVTKSFDKSKLADADDPIMSELKEKDARIIIGSFSLDLARKLMCKAFKSGLFGPKFVWMLPGWYPPQWWLDASSVPCTSEQMAKAVDGYISVTSSDALQSNYTPPDINISVDEFLDQFRTRLRNTITVDIDDSAADGAYLIQREQLTAIPPTVVMPTAFVQQIPSAYADWGTWATNSGESVDGSASLPPAYRTNARPFALNSSSDVARAAIARSNSTVIPATTVLLEDTGSNSPSASLESSKTISGALQVYDSVWVIAKALKQALNTIDADIPRRFSYENDDVTRQLVGIVQQLDFKGMSGQVTFQGADRRGKSLIQQLQQGALVPIATYDPEVLRLRFNCSQCLPLSWQVTGSVPVDRTIIKHVTLYVSFEAFAIISIIATAGAVLAGSFLAFNLRYRNTRTIKLSSPNLNNVTTIGCMLIFISIILMGLDRNVIDDDSVLLAACHLRAIFVCYGFTLAFGSLFAKTFRVYQIFRKASSGVVKSKLLRDTQLLLAVFCLTCLDSVILIVWMSVDPLQLYRRTFEQLPDSGGNGAGTTAGGFFVTGIHEDVIVFYDVEQCDSQYSTAIWMYLFYAYKGLLLVAGVFLTWQTRHVKIAALNDSQAVGFSIYNVVTCTALVIALSYILHNNVNALFIATSLLSMATTMATLCFLFVPKIVKLFKPSEPDPLLTGTGLREVSKTKRLDVDDPRENLLREEIRHRVFKHDLQRLNLQIERIEKLLSCPLVPYNNVTEEVLYRELPESSVDMSPETARKRRLLHAMDSRTTDRTSTSGIDVHRTSSLHYHSHHARHSHAAARTSPLSYTSSGRTTTTATATTEDVSTTASVRTVDDLTTSVVDHQALISPSKHHMPLLRSASSGGGHKPPPNTQSYSDANIVKISLAAYSQLSQLAAPVPTKNHHAPLAERPSRLRIRNTAAASHRKSSHPHSHSDQQAKSNEGVPSPADEETIFITTSEGLMRLLVQKDDDRHSGDHSPTFQQQTKRRLSLHQRVMQKLSPAFGPSKASGVEGEESEAIATTAHSEPFEISNGRKALPTLERLHSEELPVTRSPKKSRTKTARHSLTAETSSSTFNQPPASEERLVKKRSSIFLPFITFGGGARKSSTASTGEHSSSNSSSTAAVGIASSGNGGGIRRFLHAAASTNRKSSADSVGTGRRRTSLSTEITAEEADSRATCVKIVSGHSSGLLLEERESISDTNEKQLQLPSKATKQLRKESLNRILEDEVDNAQPPHHMPAKPREIDSCMQNVVYPGYEV